LTKIAYIYCHEVCNLKAGMESWIVNYRKILWLSHQVEAGYALLRNLNVCFVVGDTILEEQYDGGTDGTDAGLADGIL
jgi:hypothetical protein